MPTTTYEFITRDVEYLRHGARSFMARLFVPHGKGPFPAIVELHGGAWCNGNLNECQPYAEALARGGLAVAALDFRHAGDGYPTSLADINYGIRWVKANAGELNTRADLVGAAGQSSGGHLAMLAAMLCRD
jgi:acetyl esterase/lipase